jgi:acyl carrier protein
MTNAQTTDTKVLTELREFVEESFLYMRPGLALADDDKLLELGIIDSLGFVELVEEVQQRFGIEVQDVEINEDNFGSLASLAAFVNGKRA